MDVKTIAELGGLIAGGGMSGIGAKIVWDWLKNRPGGNGVSIPQKASNGFITLGFLTTHCNTSQENFAKIIKATLKAELAPIQERLKSGNKMMERTERVLKRHEEKFVELDKR